MGRATEREREREGVGSTIGVGACFDCVDVFHGCYVVDVNLLF